MINLVQFANYNVAMVVFENEACANKIWQRQTVIILLIRVPSSCSTMAITTKKDPHVCHQLNYYTNIILYIIEQIPIKRQFIFNFITIVTSNPRFLLCKFPDTGYLNSFIKIQT